MIVKISCVRDMEQIALFCASEVDYLAFDFRSDSERFFAQKNSAATYQMPRRIRRVGIFDSDMELHIISIAGQIGLNSIQMDGGQSSRFCEKIAAEGLEVIKSFTPQNIDLIDKYEGVCNKYIFRGFSIAEIQKIATATPFFVEGNVDFCLSAANDLKNNDNFIGVDCGQDAEIATAIKDMAEIEKLLNLKK